MNSARTAIKRKAPSRPTMDLFTGGHISGNVLDYGCGRGKDSEFLIDKGFNVTSYDKHYKPVALSGTFDTVICHYVMNVIEDHEDRVNLLKTLLKLVSKGGRLYITARPVNEVETAAKKGKWSPFKDGYITGNNTFQKGINDAYITDLLLAARVTLPYMVRVEFKSSSKYTIIAIERA